MPSGPVTCQHYCTLHLLSHAMCRFAWAFVAGSDFEVMSFKSKLGDIISSGLVPGVGGDSDQDSAVLMEKVSQWLDGLGSRDLQGCSLPPDLADALKIRSELKAGSKDLVELSTHILEQEHALKETAARTLERIMEKAAGLPPDTVEQTKIETQTKLDKWAKDKIAPLKYKHAEMVDTIEDKRISFQQMVLVAAQKIYQDLQNDPPSVAVPVDVDKELQNMLEDFSLGPLKVDVKVEHPTKPAEPIPGPDDQRQQQKKVPQDQPQKKPESGMVPEDQAQKKPTESSVPQDQPQKKPESTVVPQDQPHKKPESTVVSQDQFQKKPESTVCPRISRRRSQSPAWCTRIKRRRSHSPAWCPGSNAEEANRV